LGERVWEIKRNFKKGGVKRKSKKGEAPFGRVGMGNKTPAKRGEGR